MKAVTELHEELKQIAQQLQDEQGVRIERVSFDWIGTMGGDADVFNVHVETDSK